MYSGTKFFLSAQNTTCICFFQQLQCIISCTFNDTPVIMYVHVHVTHSAQTIYTHIHASPGKKASTVAVVATPHQRDIFISMAILSFFMKLGPWKVS